MSNEGHPSLTALLGLLAVAGYQNRDKLATWFRSATTTSGAPGAPDADSALAREGLSGLLGSGSGSIGSVLTSGFNELIARFNQSGHQDVAASWVSTGENKPATESQVTTALGPDVLARLSESTGLPSEEVARRLAAVLPEAVDKYTPDGRLPDRS